GVRMARLSRKRQPGRFFHVINRGSVRARLFHTPDDYRAFVRVLTEAVAAYGLPLLAYCVMPNHWHLVVRPLNVRHLSATMHWLTTTHAVRWCRAHARVGPGPVYQGRFRSIAVQPDLHLARLCRYVERNARAAGLSKRAEDWPWGSAFQRATGEPGPELLPLEFLPDAEWRAFLNEPHIDLAIARSIRLNPPFGDEAWLKAHAGGLIVRPPGPPRKTGTGPV